MSTPLRSPAPIPAPISELVLVDSHEAQGWRVRRDERLDHLFEQRCDWESQYGRADKPAVDSAELTLTYAELDVQANRLARYLRLRGARGGDRIALLFDVPAHAYVAMLAVLKIGATYVALDVAAPTGRLAWIVEDARVRMVLSMSQVAARVEAIDLVGASGAELVHLDQAAALIEEMDSRRLIDAERGALDNPLAYISYAADSGRPEGVAIDHASICNFVKVAAEMYGIRPTDRVYQGMALAFDFAVEEIWVPWVGGATLVPRPPGPPLLDDDLGRFLVARGVTALCTVPEVLGTLRFDVPGLRFLLVCGKGASADELRRWHRPGRRFLNVYGPAEATVTATWSVLAPDKPVTIGVPLPTYSTVVLDPDDPYRALPHGSTGEIGIAGIGLAGGYLNHDDLTEQAFVRDFLGIPGNPSGRIYRTGDLGRVNADGELEYLGPVPGRDRAAAATATVVLTPVAPAGPAPSGAVSALAGVLAEVIGRPAGPEENFFDDLGADSMTMARFCAQLRKRDDLPPVSMKDVYRYPTLAALAAAVADDGSSPAERSLLETLAEVLGTDVGPEQHFFDDLGADSMTMARFCARLRSRVDLPSVSIKDVYRHSTIRELARSLGLAGTPGQAGAAAPAVVVPTDPPTPEPVGTPRYVLCGALQLLVFLAYSAAGAALAYQGLSWVGAGSGLPALYLRAVAFAAGTVVVLTGAPIVAKWVLIGRWKPRRLRVWSMAYLRFWIVRTLVRTSPLVLFAGSPLYVLYLRALGARIGRGVTVLSRNVPACTDLITIGDGTVVRKDSFLSGYHAEDGVIVTGPVTIGRDCYVGEKTVLDIGTSIGDGAQLGNTSSLYPGQAVPAGARWHGSPAQPTTSDYRSVPPLGSSTARRFSFGALQLLTFVAVSLPLSLAGVSAIVYEVPWLAGLTGASAPTFGLAFFGETLLAAGVLVLGGALAGLLVVATVPRLLRPLVRPDRIYPLHGVHYLAHRVITRMTNRKFYTELFGDSSFITGYLRAVGYRLRPVVQTGSNFGMGVAHETPFTCSVGGGTVVADGLSMISADYSASSFRVSAVSIGANNFLGNQIAYPAQGRTGDNCLLATKVQIPVDGPVREGVGLLGSPAFEIPRSVDRDVDLELPADELRRRLARKNRHNAVTIALRLLVRWLHLFGVLLLATGASELSREFAAPAFVGLPAAILLFTALYYTLVERAVDPLQAHAPDGCSIYDPVFWRHERAWKVPSETFFKSFDGTPFKNLLWRGLGVRIGRRVFDDGCFLTERSFTTIGDRATLNAGSVIQCHSQEDGAFKSDHTEIAAGATLGVGSFVHYGVRVGEDAVLAPDSFLMKGEDVPPHALWGGNPAAELRTGPAADHDHRRAA